MIEWLKKNSGKEETSKSKNKQSEKEMEGSGDKSSEGDDTEQANKFWLETKINMTTGWKIQFSQPLKCLCQMI